MPMRSLFLPATALALGLLAATGAVADDQSQLIESINAYRSQPQRCANQASSELPPLTGDPRLILPVDNVGDLQQALARAAYPMVNVQAISL
ncbi:MAG: CAP domain-containing protein, partial [Pseudomonas protegens]